MNAKKTGIIRYRWNGREFPAEGASTFRRAGVERSSIPHTMGVGYRETPSAGRATCNTLMSAGMRYDDLPNGEGELQVLLDTGQAFAFPVAWTVGMPPEVNTGQASAIEFEFGQGEEIRWR